MAATGPTMALAQDAIIRGPFFSRLALGTILGFLIGLERELRHRPAGLQTSGLVTVASTLFATIAPSFGQTANLSIIANIVTGVGFLAGGVILKDGGSVTGLNTAATIWAGAAVGALAGVGLFREAIVGALVILALNAGVGVLVAFIHRKVGDVETKS